VKKDVVKRINHQVTGKPERTNSRSKSETTKSGSAKRKVAAVCKIAQTVW
jgi:hypothetical protein